MDKTAARIEKLERRVDVLEARDPTAPSTPSSSARPAPVPDLRQLEELRLRQGDQYVRGEMRGAVTYAVSAKTGDKEVLWAGDHGAPEIWDLEPASLARSLAALGHPARITLVRSLLTGPKTSQDLQEVIGSGSTGQLYHHLNDLISAGVVDQTARSQYQIDRSRIAPLLVILAAAGDAARPQFSQTDVTTDEEA